MRNENFDQYSQDATPHMGGYLVYNIEILLLIICSNNTIFKLIKV